MKSELSVERLKIAKVVQVSRFRKENIGISGFG